MKIKYLFIVVLLCFAVLVPAAAGILGDIKDAVTGHVTDVTDRVLTSEETTDPNTPNTCLLYTSPSPRD